MTHDFLPSPAPDKQHTADQIQKDLASLEALDRWMDEQLEELVAAWIHTAAPNAERAVRRNHLLHR